MPTNDDLNQPLHHDPHAQIPGSPGYEVTDANVNGVAVFLAGLGGSLLVFFIFCFVLGGVINKSLQKADGPTNKWNQVSSFEGAAANGGKAVLTTVEGEALTVWQKDGSWYVSDAKGGKAKIGPADVLQSNGVIHVIDAVLMP